MTAPLTFNAPGVKAREIDASAYGRGRGATVAGLVGVFEKGPLGIATRVTSFPQAQRIFGAFLSSQYGMHAIRDFFDNGGQELLVVRTAHYNDITDKSTLQAVKATKTLADRNGSPQNTLRVDAVNEGAWANGATGGVSVEVLNGTVDPTNEFRIKVYLNSVVVEDFDNLSMTTNAANYVEKAINDVSQYVKVTDLSSTNPAPTNRPAVMAEASGDLASGSDGLTSLGDTDFIGNSSQGSGLYALDAVKTVRVIVIPGRTGATVAGAMLTYASGRKDCYAVIETPQGLTPTTAIAYRNQTSPYVGTAFDSSFGGLYWPWIKKSDPVTGQTRFFPPSASIAGLMAASDAAAGPWAAPAGEQRGVLNQVLGLEVDVTQSIAELVFPSGLNPIIRDEGVGFVIWGQNTLQRRASATDRANVRRMLIEVESAIGVMARGVLFEPNTAQTRASLSRAINAYLSQVKDKQGVQDFNVVCNETNNPAEVVEQNRLNVDVWLKPTKTVEFVTLTFTITNQGVDFAEAFGR